MFGIITVFSILVLWLLLSFHCYRNSARKESKISSADAGKGYFSWLANRVWLWFKGLGGDYARDRYRSWITQRYPGRQRWVFICLGLSLVYLVLSGFVFALINSIRLFGLLLLLHVVLGGVFAVCLCWAVILRARFYIGEGQASPETNAASDLALRAESRMGWWRIVFFWIFVVSGVVVIITAWFQMLPQFSIRTQIVILTVHRYAALDILLSGMALFYFSLVADGHER